MNHSLALQATEALFVRKMCISQLFSDLQSDATTGAWSVRDRHRRCRLFFVMVWLQGTVLNRSETGFDLADDSGVVRIRLGSNVTFGGPPLEIGCYAQVVGEIIDDSSLKEEDEAKVKAKKVTVLSGNPHLKAMWSLEVEEMSLKFCDNDS